VSDFLSRVAARALGEAPLARPRLPALFEASAELDVVDEEIGVRSPSSAGDAPFAVSSDPGATQAPERSRRRAAVRTESRRTEGLTASSPPPTPRRDPGGPSKPSDTLSLGRSGVVGPRGAASAFARAPAAPAPGIRELARATTASAAVAVPARRAEPRAVPAPSVAQTAATDARDEPAPVRVQIGRLEVRANLHEAPRSERPRREPEPEGLALSDYLRGKGRA
jgi:hypothetical protein